ncbi:hypothetical protein HG530_011599 [Fusarium avenaceum]|nr:hypothetical protein HG530_011599 [Fusarium avenaceum]
MLNNILDALLLIKESATVGKFQDSNVIIAEAADLTHGEFISQERRAMVFPKTVEGLKKNPSVSTALPTTMLFRQARQSPFITVMIEIDCDRPKNAAEFINVVASNVK